MDNRSKWSGWVDTDKHIIAINKKKSKKKGSVIDTIIHEELHRKHPKAWEKAIDKMARKSLKRTGRKQKSKLYAYFNKKSQHKNW